MAPFTNHVCVLSFKVSVPLINQRSQRMQLLTEGERELVVWQRSSHLPITLWTSACLVLCLHLPPCPPSLCPPPA